MITIKKKKSGNARTLTLAGDLSIQNIAQLREALLGSFEGVDKVLLEFKDLEEADLSTLQVLCSAHRTSEKLNKDITLEGQYPERLQKLMEESGFSRQIGCFPDNNKNCFWTKGGM